MQTVTLSLFFSFLVLSGRNAFNYLPCRSATTITLCWTSRGYTLRHIDGVYLHRIRARTLQPHLELWRAYYTNLIRPYLGDEVLEVARASGLRRLRCAVGTETLGLPRTRPGARMLAARVAKGHLPGCCEVRVGTLSELGQENTFDSVVYVDVLEHVEDDKTEARLAAGRLQEGGALVVQAPSSSGSLPLSTRHWDTTAGAT
jgi:hypothetical protein